MKETEDVFTILVDNHCLFDSPDFVYPLRSLVQQGKVQLCLKVLTSLIDNEVSVDVEMAQAVLEQCFTNKYYTEIMEVVKKLLDASSSLTSDFCHYLVKRTMLEGRIEDAELIMKNPKISFQRYPDLWWQFLSLAVKQNNTKRAIALIDSMRPLTITEICPKLYNYTLEQFIKTYGRTRVQTISEVFNHLLNLKMRLSEQNQVECLLMVYRVEKEAFRDYLVKVDYTLNPDVFNFILNLVLEILDFETGLMMFDLVFDEKLEKISLQSVDCPKSSLKFLLKYQRNKGLGLSTQLKEA